MIRQFYSPKVYHRNHHEKARSLLEEGHSLYGKHLPKNHIWVARAFSWLGKVYQAPGDLNNAREFLERDLAIYENYYPNNHITLAWCYTHLANLHFVLGDNTKAINFLEKSKNSNNLKIDR